MSNLRVLRVARALALMAVFSASGCYSTADPEPTNGAGLANPGRDEGGGAADVPGPSNAASDKPLSRQ